mmetsp:Transcript_3529/g.5318  ORF Transcript_3529/g.5318 Transcript_3529/m.5318 type:complete len:261 (+) Transcript_3529:32-814(+)
MSPSPTEMIDPPPSSSSSTPSPSPQPQCQQRQQQQRSNRRSRPTPYLIITNISKRQNIKNLLQISAAYGCHTIFVVGQKKFEFDPDGTSGGTKRTPMSTDVPPMLQNGVRNGRMKIVRFDKLEECVEYIKSLPCDHVDDDIDDDNDGENAGATPPTTVPTTNAKASTKATTRRTIPIIGVEIDNTALNLEQEPFTSSVAFMMGNEGSGMSSKQMKACDGFIRISQYGGGTASLNVSVAAGVVLHRYFHWCRGDSCRRYCE